MPIFRVLRSAHAAHNDSDGERMGKIKQGKADNEQDISGAQGDDSWAWGWDMPTYDDEAGSMAYQTLRRAYLATAVADARQEVPTPANLEPQAPIASLLLRDLNGPRGEELLCAMVRALVGTSGGYQLLSWLANEHAGRHWRAMARAMVADDTTDAGTCDVA